MSIRECQGAVDWLLATYFPNGDAKRAQVRVGRPSSVDLDDVDRRLLETMYRCKRGDDRRRLYEGDVTGFRKPDGAVDWSGADQSQLDALAYYTDKDAARMDRLHRASGLFAARPNPEKWDEVHYADGRTYGEGTIGTAIGGCRETYRDHTGRPADAEPAGTGPPIDADTDDPAALRAEIARLHGVVDNLADVVHVQQVRLSILEIEHADCRATFQAMKDVLSNKHLRGNEARVALVTTWEIESQRSRGIATPTVNLGGICHRSGVSKNTASRVIQQLSEDETAPFARQVVRERTVGPDGEEQWTSALLVRPRTATATVSETLRAVARYTPERPQHGGSPQATAARWECRQHPEAAVIITTTARCAACEAVLDEPKVSMVKPDRPLNHQVGDSEAQPASVDDYVSKSHQLGDSDEQIDELAERRAREAVATPSRAPDRWKQLAPPAAVHCRLCPSLELYELDDGRRRCEGCGEVQGALAATPVGAGAAPAAPFVPSAEWQRVPDGYPCPPGGEFRLDFATGINWGRWPERSGEVAS